MGSKLNRGGSKDRRQEGYSEEKKLDRLQYYLGKQQRVSVTEIRTSKIENRMGTKL